ncbi:MAG: OmpH family outer membrane protein [Deltaproteobacteria bacterium]|nr:OmpH family outer membrane protein [Deltaproteobacteria bacterium]
MFSRKVSIPFTSSLLAGLAFSAVALSILPSPAAAQAGGAETKIGVVNVEEVVAQSESGKAARAEMERLQESKRGELEAKRQEILDLQKRIEDGRLSLAQDLLTELQESYESKVLDMRRLEDDANRELQKRSEKLLKGIEQQVLPIIDQVGKSQGFSVIFNKYQSGLVYASEAVDITSAVVAALNQQGSAGS